MYSSEQFEKELKICNFEELEKQYQKTKKLFFNLKEKVLYNEISQKYPAFGLWEREVRIKFPTFFIRIEEGQRSEDELENILEKVGRFAITAETNVIELDSFAHIPSLAIYCLEDTLDKNEKLAAEIERRLKIHNINSMKCVSLGHYVIPIAVDEEGYIRVLDKHVLK